MLNQAINATSKSYCTYHTSCKIFDSSERDIFVGVREYWKLCAIADRILNIQEYMEQLKPVALDSY
jgi:hypothetical protein